MTEKQIISQLKNLKSVKPKEDWVVFAKDKIFSEGVEVSGIKEERNIVSVVRAFFEELQRGERFVFNHKLVFTSVLTIAIFFGLFGFVQNSVPGNSLFVIKKMAEDGQAAFIADNYKSLHNLEMAGKRLDDLKKIAQTNDVRNLAPALEEYNETVSRAAKTLSQTGNVKEVAAAIKTLHEKQDMVKSYGVEVGDNDELDNALADIVDRELESLAETELTEEQQEILAGAGQKAEEGNYESALEDILKIEK